MRNGVGAFSACFRGSACLLTYAFSVRQSS
ncbi:hypothetical protein GMYAFLOJ_CDS0067 [Microbacterium phage phiMiGM15]